MPVLKVGKDDPNFVRPPIRLQDQLRRNGEELVTVEVPADVDADGRELADDEVDVGMDPRGEGHMRRPASDRDSRVGLAQNGVRLSSGEKYKEPIKLTDDARKSILDVLEEGGSIKDAALLHNVSYGGIFDLMGREPAWEAAVRRSMVVNKLQHLARIKRGEDRWQSSAWFLERRYREEYGLNMPDVDEQARTIRVRRIVRTRQAIGVGEARVLTGNAAIRAQESQGGQSPVTEPANGTVAVTTTSSMEETTTQTPSPAQSFNPNLRAFTGTGMSPIGE